MDYQFEGHLRALEIENDKRLDILLCHLEGTAFFQLYNLRTSLCFQFMYTYINRLYTL